jgi:hypothetical protein
MHSELLMHALWVYTHNNSRYALACKCLAFIVDFGINSCIAFACMHGKQHVHADPEKFTLLAFNKSEGHVSIEPIDLRDMKVYDVKRYLKKLWG